ncbi:MAG: hypothetical protein IBX56_12915 [Methylomicrobium sp.]|nr:hypothetical protein [Methylomicrobium sp.]
MRNTQKIKRLAIIRYTLFLTFLMSLVLLSLVLKEEGRALLINEGGVIESASALAYFLCAVFIAYKRKVAELKHFFILIILFMLRELDFHKRFTTMGISKIKFYISEDVPLIEKVVGTLVVLLFFYVCISILYRYSKVFFLGLKNHSGVAFDSLLAIILLVVSKSLDGASRKLEGFGISLSQAMSMHAMAVEEILELGIPIAIFMALTSYCKNTIP